MTSTLHGVIDAAVVGKQRRGLALEMMFGCCCCWRMQACVVGGQDSVIAERAVVVAVDG